MRYFVLFFSVVFFITAGMMNAQGGPVNFSGEWAFNEDKSDLGGGPAGRRRMVASKMVVGQEKNKLVVESFRTNRDGQEVSTVSTYTLDGKECKNESANRSSVSVAEWSEDGKALTISSTINISWSGQSFTLESTEIWTLDKDALTIESSLSTPRGERKRKAVYDKS